MTSTRRDYVIAVKREARSIAPPDLADQLRALSGVEVVSGSEHRAFVRATTGGLAEMRKAVGSFCHIEERMDRKAGD